MCREMVPTVTRSRTFKPFWHMLLWPDSRAGSEGKFRPGRKLYVGNHISPPDVLHHHETGDPHVQHMSSVLSRDLVSVEVAAEQVGTHPQTLLTRCTFPVRYPVRAPERGPRSQTHAQRRNLGISVRPGHPAPSGNPAGYSRGRPLGGSRLSLVRSGSPGADAARL